MPRGSADERGPDPARSSWHAVVDAHLQEMWEAALAAGLTSREAAEAVERSWLSLLDAGEAARTSDGEPVGAWLRRAVDVEGRRAQALRAWRLQGHDRLSSGKAT